MGHRPQITDKAAVTERGRGTFEMVAAMTIAGTIGWFVTVAAASPITIVFWRCLFAFPCLLGLCICKRIRFRLSWRQFATAMLGGLAIVTNWLLLFAAFPKASISIATIVYNSQPFMLVGLGALFLKEKVRAAQLAWLALAFAGLVLIFAGPSGAPSTDYEEGILLALGAALGWAIAALTTRSLRGVAPELIATIHVATGALLLIFIANLALKSPAQWETVATMGLVHTGFVYALMYSAVQKLPTPVQGALSFVYPVVAVIVDRVAFDRQLSTIQLTGMAAILLAAMGMTSDFSQLRAALVAKRAD